MIVLIEEIPTVVIALIDELKALNNTQKNEHSSVIGALIKLFSLLAIALIDEFNRPEIQ